MTGKSCPFRDVIVQFCAPGQGLGLKLGQGQPGLQQLYPGLFEVTPGLLGEVNPQGSCFKIIWLNQRINVINLIPVSFKWPCKEAQIPIFKPTTPHYDLNVNPFYFAMQVNQNVNS